MKWKILDFPTKHNKCLQFKFVNDQRSSNTFKAFTEGLFGDQAEGLDIPKEYDEKLLEVSSIIYCWDSLIQLVSVPNR